MKKQKMSKGLLVVTSVTLCVIVGLLFIIENQTRIISERKEFLNELYRSEMVTAGELFIEDVSNHNAILAYHHISTAAEYAAKIGARDTAVTFGRISNSVLDGELNEEMSETVTSYISRETAEPTSDISLKAAPSTAHKSSLPLYIESMKLSVAKTAANELFGGTHLFRKCERNADGGLIFTSDNAYCIIDEKTMITREMSMSLNSKRTSIGLEECVRLSEKYLLNHFSPNAVKEKILKNISLYSGGSRVVIEYEIHSSPVVVTVNADSGRISGIVRV